MSELEFSGMYPHSLDPKGRLTVPAQFRDRLVEQQKVILAIGYNRVLTIYPVLVWRRLLDELKSQPLRDPRAATDRHVRLASAFPCDVDKQGRLLISPNLRKWTGLERDVMVVGNLECVEVWDRGRWDDYFRRGLEQMERDASPPDT